MSNPIFKLEIAEDYEDLPTRKRQIPDDSLCCRWFSKCRTKIPEFYQEVYPSSHLSRHCHCGWESHRLSIIRRNSKQRLAQGAQLDKSTNKKKQMPPAFITLWKSALNKCFINQSSDINQRITTGLLLGNWVDQDVGDKWVWWSVPGES